MTSKDGSALVREKMGMLNFSGSDDQTDLLVIGLDFATTYSGYVNVHLEEKIEGIKLVLDPYREKSLYVLPSNTEAELKKLGKPALDMVTDFIGAIYRHAMRNIEGKYLKKFLE